MRLSRLCEWVDPTDLAESGKAGVRRCHGDAVFDGHSGEMRIGNELACHVVTTD